MMVGLRSALALCMLALYCQASIRGRSERLAERIAYPQRSSLKDSVVESLAEEECPEPTSILPCVCSSSNGTGISLQCSNANSEQLLSVFQQDFPVKDLDLLEISDSTEPLTLDFSTNDVTFRRIEFFETSSLQITDEFFASSSNRLLNLIFYNVEFTAEGFPFNSLGNYVELHTLGFFFAGLTNIPVMSSSSLSDISITGNSITTIEPGKIFTQGKR